MQNQQHTTTETSPGKARYWLAAVIVLVILSATLAVLLTVSEQDYVTLKVNTNIELTELDKQLREAKELAHQRQDEIDLSKEQKMALGIELSESITANEDLTKQLSQSQAETTVQAERADTAEQQLKINTDSSDMYRMLLYHTYSRLYREQKKDPQYPAIKVLDYATSKVKSLAWRKSPQAEATIRFRMGALYSTLKNYKGAQQQAELVVNSRKQLLGENHPDTINALQQLGYAVFQQGNYKLAVDTYNQALAGARKHYGNDHNVTLEVLKSISSPLHRLQRFDDVLETQQEIYRIRQISPSKHKYTMDQTIMNLGRAYREVGRYEEAEAMYRDILQSFDKRFGSDDKRTFKAKVCLAWSLRLQNKNEEADQLHKEVTSLAKFMSAISRSLADGCYGRYLTYLGNFQEAEFYLMRDFTPRKNAIFTLDGAETNPAIEALIELYVAWKKPKEAAAMRKQLITPKLSDD